MQFSEMLSVSVNKKDYPVLVNLQDTHLGARGCDMTLLRGDIHLLSQMSNVHVFLGGDIADLIGHRDPRFDPDSVSSLTRASLGKNLFDHMARLAAQIFEPIADKIVVIAMGNHEFSADYPFTARLANQLGASVGTLRDCNAGNEADPAPGMLVACPIRASDNGERFMRINLLMHHGIGAATTSGARRLALMRMLDRFPRFDVYFQGHLHEKDTLIQQTFDLNTSGTGWRPCWRAACRTGTYQKAYVAGAPSYEERKMLPISELGCNGIKLTVFRKQRRFSDANGEPGFMTTIIPQTIRFNQWDISQEDGWAEAQEWSEANPWSPKRPKVGVVVDKKKKKKKKRNHALGKAGE